MSTAESADILESTSAHPTYEEYKDSGVDWLKQIPAHWDVVPLRYYCNIPKGQVDPRTEDYRGRVLVAPNHVEQDTGRIRELETAHEQGASSGKYPVEPGDLIYSKIRPELNKVCLAKGEWLCSADMYPIKIRKGYDAHYLKYLMLSQAFKHLMVNDSMRVAMPKVNRDTLNAARILHPPFDEQRAIAAFLDRETERIDALIEKKEQLIDLLEEKRTTLISRVVTKGLDADVEMQDSGVEWLGEIPAGWDLIKLRWLTENIEQGWSPNADDREAAKDEWGVITLSAVKNGDFYPEEHKALPSDTDPKPKYEIKPGDFLLTRANTPELVGDACLVRDTRDKLMMSDLVYRLRLRNELVDGQHLMYWMISRNGRHQVERSARGSSKSMVKISQGHIKSWIAALPPLGEQRRIVDHLDKQTAQIDTLIETIQKGIDRLKEYRTALISAAVTGQIDVREKTKSTHA